MVIRNQPSIQRSVPLSRATATTPGLVMDIRRTNQPQLQNQPQKKSAHQRLRHLQHARVVNGIILKPTMDALTPINRAICSMTLHVTVVRWNLGSSIATYMIYVIQKAPPRFPLRAPPRARNRQPRVLLDVLVSVLYEDHRSLFPSLVQSCKT